MNVPDWYEAALLSLAAYRTWRLIALDTILDRPRAALVKRTGDHVDLFILCSWCCGAWCSLGWWAAWQAWPHGTLVVAALAALSAAVGVMGKLDD